MPNASPPSRSIRTTGALQGRATERYRVRGTLVANARTRAADDEPSSTTTALQCIETSVSPIRGSNRCWMNSTAKSPNESRLTNRSEFASEPLNAATRTSSVWASGRIAESRSMAMRRCSDAGSANGPANRPAPTNHSASSTAGPTRGSPPAVSARWADPGALALMSRQVTRPPSPLPCAGSPSPSRSRAVARIRGDKYPERSFVALTTVAKTSRLVTRPPAPLPEIPSRLDPDLRTRWRTAGDRYER